MKRGYKSKGIYRLYSYIFVNSIFMKRGYKSKGIYRLYSSIYLSTRYLWNVATKVSEYTDSTALYICQLDIYETWLQK